MEIGAHLRKVALEETMKSLGLTSAQVFLGSPKRWAVSRQPDKVVTEFKKISHPVFVHSSYLLNPASPNPAVRDNTRKSLQAQLDQAALVGAQGLIVHAGQGGRESTIDEAVTRWVEVLEQVEPTAKIIIENTAGGVSAPGRTLEHFAKLLDAISFFPSSYCIDTCHAWAGNFGLNDLHSRLLRDIGSGPAVVHMNGSKDAAGSGVDHHQNLVPGEVQTEESLQFALDAAVPVILETPAEGFAEDLRLLKSRLL